MIADILALVEQARGSSLSNEQANLIEFVIHLESNDDQILANRVISRGADPFAIQYFATGEVQPHIRQAHIQGPGLLGGEERDDWLFLASLSADEHADVDVSLRRRLAELNIAADCYLNFDDEQRQEAVDKARNKIKNLPFTIERIGLHQTRVYTSDLGFASAYWGGLNFAAVRQLDGLIFVGTTPRTSLAQVGIKVDKQLTDQFGIIFP